MTKTNILNGLPLLHERFLVLDLISGSPGFDLVPMALQLFDLALKSILELLLLRSICRLLNLIVYAFEQLDPFGNFLKALVNLLLYFPCGHCELWMCGWDGVLRCGRKQADAERWCEVSLCPSFAGDPGKVSICEGMNDLSQREQTLQENSASVFKLC